MQLCAWRPDKELDKTSQHEYTLPCSKQNHVRPESPSGMGIEQLRFVGGVVLVPRIPEIVPGAPTFVPLFGHLGHNRPEHKRALGEGQWPTIYR